MSCPGVARGRRLWRGAAGAALLLACVLLLSGCEANPQTTLAPQSDVGWDIQDLFVFIFWAAMVVLVVVEAALVFAVLRFRRRPGQPVGPPVGRHGSTPLEITWTLLPVVVLAVVAVPTVLTIFRTAEAAPASAVQIKVTAHQWWWEASYPKLHIVTFNEIHLPVGQTANFSLTSTDVIHSFWIPQLDGKRDVFPNHVNNLWFTPSKVGIFPGQCAEFCGPSHAYMQMKVFVQSKADFDKWVRDQQAPAATPRSAEARRGAVVFGQSTCPSCHTIAGTAAAGTIGPNLTHVGSQLGLAIENEMYNTPAKLAQWIHNSPSIKPGSYMPPQNLSKHDLAAVVAYLESLK
jgi:cytochrome c oxidase subunit II